MVENESNQLGFWYSISPAWLLDKLVRDPRRRFFIAEWIGAMAVLPWFTLIGLAIIAVFPLVLILLIWALCNALLPWDVKEWVKFILYVIFLFAAGWGLGNGLRDIMNNAEKIWERDKEEILRDGYATYRLRMRRWV